MTITAKYAATCPVCNSAIRPGDQIDWSKGAKARHATCAGGAVSAPRCTPAPRTRGPRAPYGKIECEECGDYVVRGSQCWETGMRH